MMRWVSAALIGVLCAGAHGVVKISVDCSTKLGEMRPVWRFFGADEPNYAYMKDGKRLLEELGELRPGQVYFRTHNLLTSGDGTPGLKWGSTNAYTEDAAGRAVYDWTIVDRIFDAYLLRGLRPYVEVGFMPEAMSIRPAPYQHHWTPHAKYDEIYTGWAYPPKDYNAWAALVEAWARHCVERYGRQTVEEWYWETWNEPNIGYWRGTKEEFFKLHDLTVRAIRQVVPNARVGGPDSAGGGSKFFREFLEHCVAEKVPTDFVSFHAKGSPKFVDGHVRMGISNQLRDIDSAFRIVASIPEMKGKPIVIGESDPDGCAACQGAQLGYRNGTMYSSYTAASIAREFELADRHGVNFEGALTWAFEFEDQPWFAGFRVLATNGVDLPVMNVFRMLAKMEGERVRVTSDGAVSLDDMLKEGVRGRADVSAMAAMGERQVAVMVWHYHDDDVAGAAEEVKIDMGGLTGEVKSVEEYRIDGGHSNAFEVWKGMGSPEKPTEEQRAVLGKAGKLQAIAARKVSIVDGRHVYMMTMPRQAVSLVIMKW